MNIEKINNESIVNEVLKRITDYIITSKIKPGEKIPTEVELMENLGVGRNSVREAVKMLTAMGVLEVRRGSGTYVVAKASPSVFNPLIFSMILDPSSDDNLYELRVFFDKMVLMWAIEKTTEEDIKRIEDIVLKSKDMADKDEGSVKDFVQLDLDFHAEILKSLHNELIERIGMTILSIFPKYIEKSISQKNGIRRSVDNHFKILNIIKNKEKEMAFDTVTKTLEEWKDKWK